eukprot:TRINITY_DN1884_c0_g2_i1.p1 TRINITY_DN1884_c0_g2~~TRINITY_DN1884_c0_g2_i1.p1  ORF type:complete len:373 (+),score=42.83 TRINITY_DN1884_c0_g2_i1:211-1329(+)
MQVPVNASPKITPLTSHVSPSNVGTAFSSIANLTFSGSPVLEGMFPKSISRPGTHRAPPGLQRTSDSPSKKEESNRFLQIKHKHDVALALGNMRSWSSYGLDKEEIDQVAYFNELNSRKPIHSADFQQDYRSDFFDDDIDDRQIDSHSDFIDHLNYPPQLRPKGAGNIERYAFLLNEQKSSVLHVKGIDTELVTVTMIYNLFSSFGNIVAIIFMRAKGAALIEYETIEYATISKDYLNNITFVGSCLRIAFSKYESLVIKAMPLESIDEEIFIGSPATNRFKGYKSLSINPPSNTLHISNLLAQCCREDIIGELFGQYGRVEAMKFLFHDNHRNMCLLRFATLQDGIWAAANLHNYNLEGRKIQISFTRSKV